MKITTAAITSLLATSAAAFNKYQPWGKRDYACINVYQGIPDNSTVAAGQTVRIRFNRQPTTHCANPFNKYPGENYSVWLYNNPVRHRDTISFDQQVKVIDGIPESAGAVDDKIPKTLPPVTDGSVWYLRTPSLYDAAGPFTIASA